MQPRTIYISSVFSLLVAPYTRIFVPLGFSKALDTSRISIGGIRIDPNEADKILLQSNYQVTVLTLPSKPDGTPYIEILDEYNKVLDALKKYKNELKSNGYTESNPNY